MVIQAPPIAPRYESSIHIGILSFVDQITPFRISFGVSFGVPTFALPRTTFFASNPSPSETTKVTNPSSSPIKLFGILIYKTDKLSINLNNELIKHP